MLVLNVIFLQRTGGVITEQALLAIWTFLQVLLVLVPIIFYRGTRGLQYTGFKSRHNLTGRRSPGFGSSRRSPYGTGRRSPGPVHNINYTHDPSQEDCSLDEDGRQRFFIVQPQLRQNDVSLCASATLA